jgi:hypothetical protein
MRAEVVIWAVECRAHGWQSEKKKRQRDAAEIEKDGWKRKKLLKGDPSVGRFLPFTRDDEKRARERFFIPPVTDILDSPVSESPK